ncbi:MAG: tetratricopeptide repeat protein [Betaproteobacteria bacterium]
MTSLAFRAPAVLALLLVAAGCGSKAERLDASLRKAAAYVHEGQWDKASVETRNALQIDPRNARGRALGGQIAEGRGDYVRAWQSWSAAAELAPADLDTKLALARLRLLTGDNDGATRALADLLALQQGHVGARTLQAAAQARRGETTAAIAALRALLADPRSASTAAGLLLAGLLARQGDSAGAVRTLDAALAHDPDSLALVVAGAQLADGDAATADRAIELHRRATQLAPRELGVWRTWADFHARRHELDRAEAVWRACLAAAQEGEREAAALALVDFLRQQRGVAAAQAAALAAIAQQPRTAPLRRRLADLYDDEGREADARRTLLELVALDPTAPAAFAARIRLAERDFAAGDADAALATLGDALRAHPRDAAALLLRGRIMLARGRAADAVQDLRTALHDRPGAPEVAGLLAQAYRANGERSLARDALADAVRFKPDDPALRLLLAADMADSGEPANAERELDAAIRAAPRDARAYEAKARLALARNDAAGAEKAWRALLAANPDDIGAWLSVAGMRQLRHDPKGALALFDDAEKADPQRLAIAAARAEWLARAGRTDASIAAYEALALRAPDDAAIANNLAWLLADERGDPASLARAQALVERFADVDDARRLDTLGWIQLRRGDTAHAVATLQRAARLAPGSALTQMHLGLALHASGDAARALPLLRKALASGQALPHREEAQRVVTAG